MGHTSSALHLEHALLAAVVLEGADERGGDCEDGPLTVCRRACLGPEGAGELTTFW